LFGRENGIFTVLCRLKRPGWKRSFGGATMSAVVLHATTENEEHFCEQLSQSVSQSQSPLPVGEIDKKQSFRPVKDGTRKKNGFSGDTVIGSATLHLTQWQTTTNICIAQLLWFSLSTATP